VAVHPSHSENVGGAEESLLLGVPTIATNVGGFPDLVRPGQTGWLVPPADPPKLAEAIEQALGDRAAARAGAVRGQALAREMLDVNNTVKDVLKAYWRITAGATVGTARRRERPATLSAARATPRRQQRDSSCFHRC
jgi:glycosyltransferase involved in cell wall biosynthesis